MACAGTRAASSSRTPGAVGRSGHTVPHDPQRTLSRAGAGMTDVLLRDVDDADLEVFYEQQREEEAVRRAQFPARDRDRFLTHWRTKVLGNPPGAPRPSRSTERSPATSSRGGRTASASSATGSGSGSGAAASGPRRCDSSCSASRSDPSTPTRSWQHRLGAAPGALRLPAGRRRPRWRPRLRGAQARRRRRR